MTPLLIREGDDPFGFSEGFDEVRLGDYSFTTLDPSDGLTVWTVQEYADEIVADLPVWGTWIFQFPHAP